jgi:hypothetical protein
MTRRGLPPPDARPALVAVSLTSVVFGGLLGWAGVFGGLGFAALGIGVVAALLPIGGFARKHTANRGLAFMLTYAFAFALLTWPILWLVIGYAHSLLTGEPLGH